MTSPRTASAVDFYIAQPGEKFGYTFAHTYGEAVDKLAALKAGTYPRQPPAEEFANAYIVTTGKFFADLESSYVTRPLVEIEESRFHEMLECLPPVDWHHTADGIELFCMSEFQIGNITEQFGRAGDRYFSKMVRFRDASTYISAEMIRALDAPH